MQRESERGKSLFRRRKRKCEVFIAGNVEDTRASDLKSYGPPYTRVLCTGVWEKRDGHDAYGHFKILMC